MPWGTMAYWSRRWALLAVKPSTCIGRRARHRLDAAGDDEVLEARRGCPWRAKFTACWPEPQKRLRVTPGASMRPAGVERGHAGDVHGVVAAAGAAAHDDVVDVGGVEAVAGDAR